MLAGFTPWPQEFADRYGGEGYWSGSTMGAMPALWAADHPDRTAIVAGRHRWSYADLHMRSDQCAAGFRALGIGAGDRVVVQMPNIAEFFEVMFGLVKAGAVPVVSLPAYRRSEVGYFCEATEAVAYVIVDHHAGFDFRQLAAEICKSEASVQHVVVVGDPGRFISLEAMCADQPLAAQPWPDSDPGDVALLHLSGGTTGLPKLIPRTHNDYLYGARASAEVCGLGPDAVYLAALPIAHQFPLSAPGALGTLMSGGRVVLSPNPAPDTAFPLIERERVTVVGLVPPLVAVWLDAADGRTADLSSLELLQVGGAKLSVDLARRIGPSLGCKVQQAFGMTEGLLSFTRREDPDEVVFTTQGRPLSPADEIRVVDDNDRDVAAGEAGHLLARGPYTIRGYYNAPEHNAQAFTHDGYYRTGDIVRQTPTGHLILVGRAKDQINRGGEKIAAEEVERHLLAHPAVTEAAVIGVGDPFLGERAWAYVVADRSSVSPAQLAAFLRSRGLATYKVPDRIQFIEALPRTAVGKISKQRLRDIAASSAPAITTREGES